MVYLFYITLISVAFMKYFVPKFVHVSVQPISNNYTMASPPVQGDNLLDLASGLAPVYADRP